MAKKEVTKGVWILTSEINEYNQEGAYFEAVFKEKPSATKLIDSLDDEEDAKTLLKVVMNLLENGGGRLNDEHTWYNLEFVEFSD